MMTIRMAPPVSSPLHGSSAPTARVSANATDISARLGTRWPSARSRSARRDVPASVGVMKVGSKPRPHRVLPLIVEAVPPYFRAISALAHVPQLRSRATGGVSAPRCDRIPVGSVTSPRANADLVDWLRRAAAGPPFRRLPGRSLAQGRLRPRR